MDFGKGDASFCLGTVRNADDLLHTEPIASAAETSVVIVCCLSRFSSLSPSLLIYICPSVPHSLPRFFLHLSRFQHYLALPLPCPLAGAGKGGGTRGWGGWGAGREGWQPSSSPQDAVPPLQLRGETLPPSRHPLIPLSPSTHPPLATAGSPPPIAVHQLRIPATLT